jgi:FkbM family methyltransferase
MQIFQLAKTGSVLVDVGADTGYFSLLWCGANPTGRAIAYEASKRNLAKMKVNIHENKLGARINLVPKAVGNRSGSVAFDDGPIEQTRWGGISVEAYSGTSQVPIVRLDDEFKNLHIDVLKLDVEGADTWVLFGCEALLKKRSVSSFSSSIMRACRDSGLQKERHRLSLILSATLALRVGKTE